MVKRTRTGHQRYAEFIKRLTAARKDAGLTQTSVAKHLGKPRSYVSKCEMGERRIDVVELCAFAKMYGKRLDYFDVDS